MTLFSRFSSAIALSFVFATFSSLANASLTISLSDQGINKTSIDGATTIDFNSGCGYMRCDGDYILANGSLDGYYGKPLGVDSQYLSVPNPSPTSHSATFSLGEEANYFGLFWGSIDSFNIISFLLDDNIIASYSGADIFGHFADGNQFSENSNRYINFDFENSTFNTVKLQSSNFAFESDNHAFKMIVSQVSESSSYGLLLIGLASLFAMKRRKITP